MEAGLVILVYSYLGLPILSKYLPCYLEWGGGCSTCLSLSLSGSQSSGFSVIELRSSSLIPRLGRDTQVLVRHHTGHKMPSMEEGQTAIARTIQLPRGPRLVRLYSFQEIVLPPCYQATCLVWVTVANGLEFQCLHCIDFHLL